MILRRREAEAIEVVRTFLKTWKLLQERIEQIGPIYVEEFHWFRPDLWGNWTIEIDDCYFSEGIPLIKVSTSQSYRGGTDYGGFELPANLLWKEDDELHVRFREAYEFEQRRKEEANAKKEAEFQRRIEADERAKLAKLLEKYPDVVSTS